MAFNFGAFAGAAAQSGMNTYQTLEAIESQKKRDALVELQAQEARAAAEERTALKGAASSTYGQVGAPETALPGRKLSEAEVTNAYAIDQGDASAIPPKAYTQTQADADYLAKVRGISPERALDIEGKQTQTAIGKSSLSRIKAEDEFSTWLQESQAQAAKDPVGFLKNNLNAYNNAKKGSHLDDGNTASVVASADGKSFSFVRTDAKGKLVDSTPINPASAGDALKHIAFSKYASLPGKFKESEELGMRRTEVDLKGKEFGLKERLLPSEIAKNNAAANQANAHAGVFSTMVETAKTNKAAGEAMQPFLDKLAALPETATDAERQDLMMKAATAGAQKSRDIAGLLTIMRKPDKSGDTAAWNDIDAKMRVAGAPPKDIEAQRVSFFEGRGYAPSAKIAVLEGGRNPKDGKRLTEADVDAFNRAYPNTQIDKAKLSWLNPETKTDQPKTALPNKNSDFAVRGGRGVYTVSGIPQTFTTRDKAEAAAKAAGIQSRSEQVRQALERDQ